MYDPLYSGHLVEVLGNEFTKKKVLPWEVQQARDEIAYQAHAITHDPAFQVGHSIKYISRPSGSRESMPMLGINVFYLSSFLHRTNSGNTVSYQSRDILAESGK